MNKILTTIMAGTMMMGSILPVCAATTENQNVEQEEANAGTTRPTDVLYEKGSTFSVTIPKTIVLDVATKTSDYTVNVKGDISSDKQVKVSPVETFLMVDQANVADKKEDVTATVTQNETIWTSAEVCELDESAVSVGTDKVGTISATDLTSGAWKGTFDFTIALQDA